MLWVTRAVSIPTANLATATIQPLPMVSHAMHETYHSVSHLQRSAQALVSKGRAPVVDFVDATTGRRWRWDGRHRTSVAGRQLLELWGPPAPQPSVELPRPEPRLVEAPAAAPAVSVRAARGERLAAVRALLLLRREWLTPSEVAAALGCSRSAASSALRRAARAGLVRHNGEANRASRYSA